MPPVCVPGAQLTETIDEDHFKGKVTIKIGPVTAKFNGDVEFIKRDSSTYELSMEGKGADISGKGRATMNMELSLNAHETFTEISWIMTVSIKIWQKSRIGMKTFRCIFSFFLQ